MASLLGTGPSLTNGSPAVVTAGRYERALALTTPDETQGVPTDAPGVTLVGSALARRVLDLLHYEVLIRLRSDPEDVHHARSTVRRLRAMLRGFRPFLDRSWVDTLREELRWYAGELATVRDIDVTIHALRSRVESIPAAERLYVEAVLEPLESAGQAARTRLLATLDDSRYRASARRARNSSHHAGARFVRSQTPRRLAQPAYTKPHNAYVKPFAAPTKPARPASCTTRESRFATDGTSQKPARTFSESRRGAWRAAWSGYRKRSARSATARLLKSGCAVWSCTTARTC